MKYTAQIKSACLGLGLLFSVATHAEAPALESFVNVMTTQMLQKAAGEIRILCASQFPDLQAQLDEAYSSSALMKTVISIRVNGQEFQSQENDDFVRDLRQSFGKQEEAKRRKMCTGYSTVLDQWAYIGEHSKELGQQAEKHLAARRRAKQAEPPLP